MSAATEQVLRRFIEDLANDVNAIDFYTEYSPMEAAGEAPDFDGIDNPDGLLADGETAHKARELLTVLGLTHNLAPLIPLRDPTT